jgi:hypothetical protein
VKAEATVLSMTQLAEQGSLDRQRLVTRPVGQRFLPLLEAALQTVSTAVAVLDFSGVELIDASFADEVFGSIAAQRARRKGPPVCLALCAVNAASLDNLDIALASRPAREPGLRNCVIPVISYHGRVDLIGKAEAHVTETANLLCSHGELTARDLADTLGLDIAAASTRLKAVADLGLATRKEARDAHGKLFTYYWPW